MPELAGHGAARDPTDYYATTPDLARLICSTLKRDYALEKVGTILEPGCGAGTFLGAIQQTWPQARVRGIELHGDLAEWSRRQGFDVALADLLRSSWGTYDLIVGNPPFRFSEPFVHHLRAHLAPGGVLAFILRLNFLAGQERYASLWSAWRPHTVYPLPARPGFTPDGKTDGTDYMVCTWTAMPPEETRLRFLDNRGVANRWTDPSAYPDPRRDGRCPPPDAALVKEGANALDYEPNPRGPRITDWLAPAPRGGPA